MPKSLKASKICLWVDDALKAWCLGESGGLRTLRIASLSCTAARRRTGEWLKRGVGRRQQCALEGQPTEYKKLPLVVCVVGIKHVVLVGSRGGACMQAGRCECGRASGRQGRRRGGGQSKTNKSQRGGWKERREFCYQRLTERDKDYYGVSQGK